MPDDTIIRPNFGSRPVGYDDRDATCTGTVPSPTPDAPHVRGDNFRQAKKLPHLPRIIPPDLAPRSEADERRRQLRDMLDRNDLIMAELKSQRAILLDLLGDDNPPKGAA